MTAKVSVQGVVALGGHFATLCQKLDFYKAFLFFIINFQKEKVNTLTLLIILIVKSLKIGLHSTNLLLKYYDPQSAGINVQSPQSATTPKRLTLIYGINQMDPFDFVIDVIQI